MIPVKCVPAEIRRLEIPEPTDAMAVLKFLEEIGRVCYKSEENITDDSAITFIKNIKKRKHWAMLEHYIFTLEVDEEDFNILRTYFYINSSDCAVADKMKFINLSRHKTGMDENCADVLQYLISGSATAFNYLLEAMYISPYGTVWMLSMLL